MIRLLSTDFDGTLADFPGTGPCVPELASELEAVVVSGGLWVVNTGRSVEAALDGLNLLKAPVKPHYLLTSERHVHKPDGRGGWSDFGDWNDLCRDHHDRLFAECGRFFEGVEQLVSSREGLVMQRNSSGVPEGLIAGTEEQLDEATAALMSLPGRPEDFHHQRSSIYLRFCHRAYDKGSALAELARLLDMPTSYILTVGDHQNDLPMLFGDVAGMVACPANAHPDVKQTVRDAGGHVSEYETGRGTAEAIHLYRTGKKKAVDRSGT
jgi:hydroxymethylpyrimidine pyrophosphatase-like HAD family hydrolase